MKITVNEQAQRFYLATNRWEPLVGHEIRVGKYQFCAIPIKDVINVSEATTGTRLFNVPVDSIAAQIITSTKEGMIQYLLIVGKHVKRVIEKQADFDGMLAEMKKHVLDRLGEMPPIENVDTDWLENEISDVLN